MKGTTMPKRTLLSQYESMSSFVKTNLKTVDETLEELPSSTPEELKDLLETLQQSLMVNRALMIALDQHPLLKKVILNKS